MAWKKTVLIAMVVTISTSCAVCGWCIWDFSQLAGRSIATVDIGQGRVIRIWSTQSERDWPGGPVSIYYQVLKNGEEIIPTRYIWGGDHGQRFEFKAVYADKGKLVCLFDTVSVDAPDWHVIIYDAHTNGAWPGRNDSREWRNRYLMLKESNPGMPRMRDFE